MELNFTENLAVDTTEFTFPSKTFELEVRVMKPYTQKITVEANNSDEAINKVFDTLDFDLFASNSSLTDCEVEVVSISPDDWDDDEDEEDED